MKQSCKKELPLVSGGDATWDGKQQLTMSQTVLRLHKSTFFLVSTIA